jgi:hypothetical protein
MARRHPCRRKQIRSERQKEKRVDFRKTTIAAATKEIAGVGQR